MSAPRPHTKAGENPAHAPAFEARPKRAAPLHVCRAWASPISPVSAGAAKGARDRPETSLDGAGAMIIVPLMNGRFAICGICREISRLASRWLRPSFLVPEMNGRPARPARRGPSVRADAIALPLDRAMELRLYDTLAREKRASCRSIRRTCGMYVCGPTVYDFAHIGNARPVIVFDVLFRLLRIAARSLRRKARPCHLCPQHHRRGRQDQCAGRAGVSRSRVERGDPQGHRHDGPPVS